jgi:hypothetical protein
VLCQAILSAADNSDDAEPLGNNGHGEIYILRFPLQTQKGIATVLTAWIVRDGEDFPRFKQFNLSLGLFRPRAELLRAPFKNVSETWRPKFHLSRKLQAPLSALGIGGQKTFGLSEVNYLVTANHAIF